MRKTEQNAYNWLLTQGYTQKDISYQKISSPDFICSDGKKFEIKRLYQNTVIFSPKQQYSLDDNTIILVFRDEDISPFIQVKFDEIKDLPKLYKKVHFISWYDIEDNKYGTMMIVFLDDNENKIVKELAEKWNLTKHNTIKILIQEFKDADLIVKNIPKSVLREFTAMLKPDENINSVIIGLIKREIALNKDLHKSINKPK